jgi:formylglycine-generating enzyme required for sulfatase activity
MRKIQLVVLETSGRIQSNEGMKMRALIVAMVLVGICPAYAQQPQEITNSIGMKFASISAGSFIMGSSEKEAGRHPNETSHRVTISESFYLGRFEVTQNEYEKVTGTNPSTLKGSQHPVETLDWEDAVAFCRKLSEFPEEKAVGRVYRLPTEAEWEYGCRAGSETPFSFGESAKLLHDHAWYEENSKNQHHPVGEKRPNQWGLYDMQGNVCEWCNDWYGDYPSEAVIDPQGPIRGSERVIRGGSWMVANELHFRSSQRSNYVPKDRSVLLGFRVVLKTRSQQP